MTKISVVVPTRDRDDLIGETIQSIIDQTEADWELIVVDDHSKKGDKTQQVIDNFSDPRIKYFRLTDENGIGISAARNFGVMMANSDIILFCDSDDVCYPNRLELTLEAFEEKGVDVVWGDLKRWNSETGEITNQTNEFQPREFDLESFKQNDYVPLGTAAIRKSVLLEFPFNSFFRRAEDWECLLRIAKRGHKFKFVNQPFIKYRRHSGSITKATDMKYNYGRIVKNSCRMEEDE